MYAVPPIGVTQGKGYRMSLYDYEASKRIALDDPPFSALIMAAMRKADDINTAKLKAAWPETYAEIRERYNAPGGLLEREREA